jgi:hypothetical protein
VPTHTPALHIQCPHAVGGLRLDRAPAQGLFSFRRKLTAVCGVGVWPLSQVLVELAVEREEAIPALVYEARSVRRAVTVRTLVEHSPHPAEGSAIIPADASAAELAERGQPVRGTLQFNGGFDGVTTGSS